jgi:hypothetical protein
MSLTLPPTSRQNETVILVKNNGSRRVKKQAKRKAPNRRNQKKSQKKTQSPGIRAARQRMSAFYLSPCADHYLRALVDPFSLEGGSACIPDEFDFPSAKRLVITRGTMAVGTLGVGWLIVSPNTFANDVNSWVCTSANYAGSSVGNSHTANVVSGAQNLPFSGADFVPTGFSGRWVGFGVRMRYLGTELNRSGRIIPIRLNRIGQNLMGATAQDFLASPEIPSIAVTRTWKAVTLLPRGGGPVLVQGGANLDTSMVAGDTVYTFGTTPYEGVTPWLTYTQGYDIGFWVDGSVAGNAFEWEIYSHYEFISAGGGLAPDGLTSSHSDAPGVSAIRNALESNLPVGDTSAALNHALKFLKDYAPADISHVANGVMAGTKLLGWR